MGSVHSDDVTCLKFSDDVQDTVWQESVGRILTLLLSRLIRRLCRCWGLKQKSDMFCQGRKFVPASRDLSGTTFTRPEYTCPRIVTCPCWQEADTWEVPVFECV